MSVRPCARTEPSQSAVCHQFEVVLGGPTAASVDSTSASNADWHELAGDAPSSTSQTAKVASVEITSFILQLPKQRPFISDEARLPSCLPDLFEAARRSRASAYLADDDYGPLALQEILLAGCPTVGVRTGASIVQHGETGVLVDRLPPGRHCAESDDDARALKVFMEAIEQAQSMDRHSVRKRAAEQFDTNRIVESVITAVNKARLG